MTSYSIRKVNADNPAEIDRLYEICLLTGDSGKDASDLYTDPRLIGELYVGAYPTYNPEFCFVLVDENDVPVGYTVGVPDSVAFDAQLDATWWPPLREKYSAVEFPADSKDAGLVQTLMNWGHTNTELAAEYPAHLHIDILPEAQGGGNGKKLLFTLIDAFRDAGIKGFHLGVGGTNENAIGFYQHVGLEVVVDHEWGKTMGMHLTKD